MKSVQELIRGGEKSESSLEGRAVNLLQSKEVEEKVDYTTEDNRALNDLRTGMRAENEARELDNNRAEIEEFTQEYASNLREKDETMRSPSEWETIALEGVKNSVLSEPEAQKEIKNNPDQSLSWLAVLTQKVRKMWQLLRNDEKNTMTKTDKKEAEVA